MFVQDLGKKVAISEQIEIPAHEREQRPGAPKFDRKVTRVITAGTLIDESFIDPLEKNFLLSIKFPDDVETSSIPEQSFKRSVSQRAAAPRMLSNFKHVPGALHLKDIQDATT